MDMAWSRVTRSTFATSSQSCASLTRQAETERGQMQKSPHVDHAVLAPPRSSQQIPRRPNAYAVLITFTKRR